jgi:hypothetical protein
MIMKNTDDFLIAHVELSKARFTRGEDLGIEFKNEIDAWTKMEVHFRHLIRNPRKRGTKSKADLTPFVYSFRQALD